ncbi:FecR domain-containing protein [Methylophilus flavus]|uniref:FecR domain-containing protein n=1 Tax=Methylophilus flavus TaxID=640084 RepID=A0ABW3PFS2_9PROT
MTREQLILNQASEWFAVLQDKHCSEQDYQQWQAWLAQDAAHARVWQRVEALSKPFQTLAEKVPANLARETLDQVKHSGRRQALRLLGLGSTVVATGLLLRYSLPWQGWRHEYALAHAAYRTRLGERLRFKLADGTQLTLNTASMVDVEYDEHLRRIILHQGEIHVESAHDTMVKARPLVVDTSTARITALGTRFTVRSDLHSGHVAVFDGAVQVAPEKTAPLRVEAGRQVRFNIAQITPDGFAELAREAWSAGKLVADNIALRDFIDELSRYTPLTIHVSPDTAKLRLVGVYSIANPASDIPVILAALEHALPIHVQKTSPANLTIIPR